MFHVCGFDLLVDIDAHRAVPGARFAVDAVFRLSPELEGWPTQNVPEFSAEDHEGRDPAPIVAEGVPSHCHGKDQKNRKHREVGDVLKGLQDGNPALCHVKRLNLFDPAGPNQSYDDEYEPGCPDEILDTVMFGTPLGVDAHADVLETSHRTDPTAESPPDKEGRSEKHDEQKQAAGDDPFEGPAHAQIGGKIVQDNGKAQKHDQDDGFPDFLTHRLVSSFILFYSRYFTPVVKHR